jgi:hypothetical protein
LIFHLIFFKKINEAPFVATEETNSQKKEYNRESDPKPLNHSKQSYPRMPFKTSKIISSLPVRNK